MPRLQLARGYSTQPQQAAKPDHANVLTRGLVALTNFGMAHPSGRCYDAVTGTPWANNGSATLGNTNKGRGMSMAGSAGNLQNAGITLATKITGPWTVFFLASANPGITSVYCSSNTASAPYCANFSGTWSISNTANGSVAANNTMQAVAFRQTATVGDVTVNGIKGTGNAQNYAAWPAGAMYIGDFGTGGGFPISGNVALMAVWNRALTDSDIQAITRNPWQLFRAPATPLEKALNVVNNVYGVSVAETLAASDTPDRDGGGNYNLTQAEASSAADTPSGVMTTAASVSESGTAADSQNTGAPAVRTVVWSATSVGSGWATDIGSATFTLAGGETILVYWNGVSNADQGTISDSVHGTLSRITAAFNAFSSSGITYSGWAAVANASSGSHTITAPTVAGGDDGLIVVYKITNMPSTLNVRTAGKIRQTTSSQTITCTTTGAAAVGDLVFGGRVHENTVGFTDTITNPSGWTSDYQYLDGSRLIPTDVSSIVATSAATVSGTWVSQDTHISDTTAAIVVLVPSSASSGSTYSVSASESGTAADTASNVMTSPQTVTEAGTAADTPSGIMNTTAAVTEAGSAADVPSGGSVTSASAAEAGSAADAPSAGTTTAAALTESGTGADTASSGVTTQAAVTEAGTAVDTEATTLSTPQAVAEAGSAVDTPSGIQTSAQAVSEAGTALDAPSTSGSSTASVSEAGTAAETPSAVMATPQAVSEAGAAVDVPAGALVTSASTTEAGAAADAPSAAGSMGVALTESGTAADTVSQIGGTLLFMIEALTGADTTSAQGALVAAMAEALAGGDTVSDVVVMAAAIVEAGVVADFVAQGSTITAAVVEAGALADAVSILRTVGGGVAEALLASDASGLSAAFVATCLESGTVVDLVAASAVLGAALAEAAAAAETSAAQSANGLSTVETLSPVESIEWVHIAFTLVRTFAFARESRSFTFSLDTRSHTFAVDSRSNTFPADGRSHTFPESTP